MRRPESRSLKLKGCSEGIFALSPCAQAVSQRRFSAVSLRIDLAACLKGNSEVPSMH